MPGDSTVRTALLVSLGVTVVGTGLSMVVPVLCAYGLSRSRSLGHRFILLLLIVTMFVGGGMIPTFLVITGLGGYNNSGSGNANAQTAPLPLQMAVVVLTLVPLPVVHPFVQKHFRTGVLTGAIKG